MAVTTASIMVGAATVSESDWVPAAGAGSFTDLGHTKTPVTIAISYEDYEVRSERAFGTLKKVPQTAKVALKIPLTESILENWRIATRQVAGSLTGTPPDMTLLVGDQNEQYHQMKVEVPGVGTTGARVLTLWRCIVESLAELPFAKGLEQLLEMTMDVLYDDSVATVDKFFKVVDA